VAETVGDADNAVIEPYAESQFQTEPVDGTRGRPDTGKTGTSGNFEKIA
jgi:hypothetical protein